MDGKEPDFRGMLGVPWIGRGRGLQSEEPTVGGSRGLLLPPEGPGLGRTRGILPIAGDAPAGRGAALPVVEPVLGRARGLLMHFEDGGFGRSRGLLPTPEPRVGIARGATLPTLETQHGASSPPLPGLTEEIPTLTAKEVDMPAQRQESPLVSMFRGMGIEPIKSPMGRGSLQVGRGPTQDPDKPKLLGSQAGDISPQVVGQPEEAMGRQSSVHGRGLFPHAMAGLGRGAMPQLGAGRGPSLLPSFSRSHVGLASLYPEPQPAALSQPSHAGAPFPVPATQDVPEPLTFAPAMTEPKTEAVVEPLKKTGTHGTVLNIGSNHISINCKNEAVYQYHVTFVPNVESMSMRFGMMKDHRSTTGEVVAFDGSILYLPVKLDNVVVLKSLRRTDNEEVEIKIQMTKILPPSSDLCIPFYNLVLRRVMKIIGLKLVGRNHYDPENPIPIEKQGLQVWRGYSTCIKRSDGGLLLSVDVSHKVLRNDSVLDVMNVLHQQSRESFQDECTKELIGSIVITRYNNRTYRIDDIEWTKSPKDSFVLMNGTKTTFAEYYRKNYGITIKEMEQPLLVHRPKERSRPGGKQIITGEILLVPELSFMTGIPDKMRKDFRAMKELTEHINISSERYCNSVFQLLKNIRANQDSVKELSRWGLEIESVPLEFQGRTLPRETIFLQSSSFASGSDGSWSRDVVRDLSISVIPLNMWAIFYSKRCAKQAEELVDTLKKVAGPIGVRLERPIRVELKDDRTESYVKSIHSQLASEPDMQLVVCIIVGNRDDLYNAIKKLCCTRSPVPSQVINIRTISGQPQKLRSISQKILLQINCKLGGELWTVNVPLKNLMVIGVDVHHDTSKRSQSVMGFVASLNSSLTRWYSRVTFQAASEELIKGFRVCFLAALQKYYEANHNLPEKIVVFRDGVSDSQLKVVEQYEIPQLINCFETFRNYEPKLVFIVVKKRINTTIYSWNSEGCSTSVPPGTVLDHTLTHKDWVDFFLMAHQSRQGCGLPTHYVVLYNTANLSADHLQRLTFKMCHLYWNWPGTIRVPAPCKYAHKLAFLTGQCLHTEPAIQLSDKLYYL